MADTPEAAPVAPVTGTEETPNTTPQTTETTTPVAAPQGEAQPQPDNYGFTNDQLSELSKFIKGQGGYDKAFNAWKNSISKPVEQVQQPVSQSQPVEQPQMTVEEQVQALQTPAGFVSPKEFMAQQYYNNLANQEEFKPIADKIRSGEVFNEMRKFGIQPMDQNGNINDLQAREFLGLLAKTVPAQPAQTPESAAAPTVDYIPTNGGKIESYEQAARIIAQSEQLRGQNQAEHPDLAAAKEFIKNSLTAGRKK